MLGSEWIDQSGVLKLDQNERSEQPPRWAVEALRQVTPFALNRYPKRQRLEAKLAAHHGLAPDQVLVTNGSDEAIQYLFQSLPSGLPVILPLPTFGVYQDQIARWPIQPERIAPLLDLRLDVAAILEKLHERPQGLLILVRPNNPTGESLAGSHMDAIIAVCRETGSQLLLDEAYADFSGESWIDQIAEYPNLWILRTFSKAYGLAGMRVGYLVGQASLIEPVRRLAMPYNVSTLALLMAECGCSDEAQRDVRQYSNQIRRNTEQLMVQLREWGLTFVQSSANFVMIKLGPARAEFVRRALAAQSIKVRVFDRPELDGWVRVSVPMDMDRLMAGLEAVLRPDLICLDVDGCLVDVRDSFEATVIEAVRRLTGGVANRDQIIALRAAGGLNDDWELTEVLVRQAGYRPGPGEVRDMCELIYWGTQDEPGYVRLERAILEPATLALICAHAEYALVTGRSQRELAPARELLGLPLDIPASTIDMVQRGKPDPEGIVRVRDQIGASRVWMVGDNVDDIRAGVEAGAVPIGVGADMIDALYEAGAAVVLKDINQIGALL